MDDLSLAIDLGTSSVRAALVDRDGRVVAFASRGFAQVVPRFAWAEQSATAWWQATVAAIREVVAATDPARIAAICACGQMHGTVLVDAAGAPARDAVLLWNDKRSIPELDAWSVTHPYETYAPITANPATPAWPAFKLLWLRDHEAEAYARATTVLSPKDFINFRLSGVRATDRTEASASFLCDCQTGRWSDPLVAELGLRRDFLPEIREPFDIIGAVTAEAAAETGLRPGTPVLAGGGDLPVALLGSGATTPGIASDIAGTSVIATLVGAAPRLSPDIANVALPGGNWGAFTLVDSGGEALRWVLRAFGNGGEIAAAAAEAGSGGLFFLPFLSGERLGASRNSRAQFFGLDATHGKPELQRAVLEGVAFALKRQFDRVSPTPPERFIAAGAGGKSDLWLTIKASTYGVPFLVPEELECGVVGCAMLSAVATGKVSSLAAAALRMVRIAREIAPDPAWQRRYEKMLPVFSRIADRMAPLYDDLDALAEID